MNAWIKLFLTICNCKLENESKFISKVHDDIARSYVCRSKVMEKQGFEMFLCWNVGGMLLGKFMFKRQWVSMTPQVQTQDFRLRLVKPEKQLREEAQRSSLLAHALVFVCGFNDLFNGKKTSFFSPKKQQQRCVRAKQHFMNPGLHYSNYCRLCKWSNYAWHHWETFNSQRKQETQP